MTHGSLLTAHTGLRISGLGFAAYDTAYLDSVWLALAPGESAVCQFPAWTATPPETFLLAAITVLASDTNPDNDTATGSVIVRRIVHDVGVAAILAPTAETDLGDTVKPAAVLKDYGTETEVFQVRFLIGTTWRDSLTDTLQPGATDTVEFRSWVAEPVGLYVDQCSTALAGDMNPANDFILDSFQVVATGVAESVRRLGVPTSLKLAGGSPNPFCARTSIAFGLPRGEQFRLAVYNSVGDLVRVLASGYAEPGYYTTGWSGIDEKGCTVARGIYFVRLQTGDAVLTNKLVRLQ
jgi:hypothetical protein